MYKQQAHSAVICCVCVLLQLVPLESSKLKGLVNTRVGVMQEIGWDPEWEVRQGGRARKGLGQPVQLSLLQ